MSGAGSLWHCNDTGLGQQACLCHLHRGQAPRRGDAVVDGVSCSPPLVEGAVGLGPRIATAPNPGGGVLANSGYTFGLGWAVRPADGLAMLPGSAGDYNWSGYAGTGMWIDPKEELVAVFMVQSAGSLRTLHRNRVRQLVYQAIAD